METISRSLLTFLVNSLWQIPLVAAVAALACRTMRNGPAVYRHAVWVAALAAAVLLPLGSTRRPESPAPPHFDASLLLRDALSSPAAAGTAVAAPSPAAPLPSRRSISFAETTTALLIGIYLLFVLARLVRLGLAALRTAAIRRRAYAAPVPELLDRVWNRCAEAFGVTGAVLLFSDELAGPVTAGNAVILPESLREQAPEEVLTTAIGHEMAHVARHDFASNLCFEILRLPIGFHPAAWLIRRGIEGAREMACDEMVTARVIEPGAYARSIVSIAAGIARPAPAGCTLSVLDGNNFEERIRRLVERPVPEAKRARLLLATGLTALAACALIASSVAFTARAQSATSDLLKQATAAYNRGDYQTALGQFENAVQIEPGNLKAKLLLAQALMHDYTPGMDPNIPAVALATQQYRDALQLDPRNRAALDGMLLLLTNTRQYPAAHEWALKAIAADATDKTACYTAGFLDWIMTYPDYRAARIQAGMQPTDAGNIPDTALRLKLRQQHEAQVEDGLEKLQAALQLDPDDSDSLAFMNLLNRIQAGLADTPEEAAEFVAKANERVRQAIDAKRRSAQNRASAPKPVDADALALAPFLYAPPPPPLPPPPPQDSPDPLADGAVAGNAIHVGARVQQMKLIQSAQLVYPPLAIRAGVSGDVVLNVRIDESGSVASADVLSGPPLLAAAAVEAVRQWKYQTTMLNDRPVGVITQVTCNFTIGQ